MMLSTSLFVVGRVTGYQREQLLLLLFTHQVVSNSSWPHELQHSKLPCPSLTPRICWNSCPLSIHDTIQSSHPLSPPSPAFNLSQHQSFPMNWLFASGGQSIRTLASVLPMNIQGWSPLGLIGLMSLLSKGLSRVFSSTTDWKHQFFSTQPSLWSTSHICTWLLEKPWLWLYRPLSAKCVFAFYYAV